jgi:hypothetical protein
MTWQTWIHDLIVYQERGRLEGRITRGFLDSGFNGCVTIYLVLFWVVG